MSLEGQYDTENIFAKILRGEMPAVILYEDENILAFMDVFPQTEGHVLLIPKAPARNLLDAKPENLGELMIATQKVAKAVKAALKPVGIVITQFNGAPAGQTVFHLHFHIIPRYEGDAARSHASGRMVDVKKLELIAAKIKAQL